MQSKNISRCTSVFAVALAVMSATALDAGMSPADAERYAAIDNAIASGLNGGRRLQGGWCNVVSETETYCCGFGGRASCISRGLEYSGPNTPCEVRLVTDSDGQESCVGLEGTSGNLDEDIDCNCEDLSTDPPVTDAPSPTPPPSVEETTAPAALLEGATPAPSAEEATAPPAQVQTPAPVDTPVPVVQPGDTPAPSAGTRDGTFTMAPLAEGETMAPAADVSETMAPLAEGETMAPAADVSVTMAPLAPGETRAPAADVSVTMAPLAPGETRAPAAVVAGTPSPSAGTRDFTFTMAPTDSMGSSAPTSATMAPSGAPTMMTAAPSMAPTVSTGAPSVAPTMVPTAMPTAGSRALDFGSSAPTSAPTLVPPGTTLAPDQTLPPLAPDVAGSASLSSSNIVAFAATVGGLFAAFAAARN